MMDDVMVQPTGKPAHNRVLGRVIGCGSEDIKDAIVKLAADRGEVGAVNGMGGLKYERYAQSHDQMNQEKRACDKKGRSSEHQHWQNKHICDVEALADKEHGVLTQRVPCALQVFVHREEKALKVSDKHIVERKQRVNYQCVNMLESVPWRSGFMGCKAEDAASRNCVIFTL